MEVTVRPATAGDLDVVADLATTAIAELRPMRGGEVWYRQVARREPTKSSLFDDLNDGGATVLVGCIDDTIVGYAAARVEHVREGKLAVVSDLYVLEGARAVGIGESLMDALLDWARDRNCFGIDSIALPGDRQTKNFFESFGLKARAIIVHRSLLPEE